MNYIISCRRFVWNFFRLENEHLNNCGQFRAVRDISITPLNANDQALLEQMMDEEDGVTNRRAAGSRPWKQPRRWYCHFLAEFYLIPLCYYNTGKFLPSCHSTNFL